MRYPITPEYLDAAPQSVVEAFLDMEEDILKEICRRFALTSELNEVALRHIRNLISTGLDLEEIQKIIAKYLNVAVSEVAAAFERAVMLNQSYYTFMPLVDISHIIRQTTTDMENMTRSLGFATRQNGKLKFNGIAETYQKALNKAELKLLSGGFTAQQAIADAVRELAGSGIRVVIYDSGHADHADVAVRRAVITGLTQISDQYAQEAAKTMGATKWEITAHRGARDKGEGWQNHKAWQGRVYTEQELYTICGFGAVDGLEGANCRHRRFPFLEGVSTPTYTEEMLNNIDPPPIMYQGKEYTAYEATQQQRRIERTIRKIERFRIAFEAANDTENANIAGVKLQRLKAEYKRFSAVAGLPLQADRMKVQGV